MPGSRISPRGTPESTRCGSALSIIREGGGRGRARGAPELDTPIALREAIFAALWGGQRSGLFCLPHPGLQISPPWQVPPPPTRSQNLCRSSEGLRAPGRGALRPSASHLTSDLRAPQHPGKNRLRVLIQEIGLVLSPHPTSLFCLAKYPHAKESLASALKVQSNKENKPHPLREDPLPSVAQQLSPHPSHDTASCTATRQPLKQSGVKDKPWRVEESAFSLEGGRICFFLGST